MPSDYRFEPVTRADLPMLGAWLRAEHLGDWWGDAAHELDLIEGDLDGGPTDMRIVWTGDTPFAYVQDYPASHWPMPQYADQPAGTRALDMFIGEKAMLGKGHGAGLLRARSDELIRAGAPAVVVDPDPANTRAIASYTAAGFEIIAERPCEDGDPVLVMVRRAATAPEGDFR